MTTLPPHKIVEGNKVVEIDKDDEATIIFKCEGAVKDVVSHLAKTTNGYGNTMTAVITKFLADGLETQENITFDEKLKALTSAARIRVGEAIPYHIKSQMKRATEESNIAFWMDAISAKEITVEEAKQRVENANGIIMNLMEQGYNPADFHTNKKSFGYKWVEGDWIYEVSRKTDEEETVKHDGRDVTRLKRDITDRHYLQYSDNGITPICPNIFTNALYKEYYERDEYFNNELRKVGIQHSTYKDDGNEVEGLIDECCPTKDKKTAMNIIFDRKNIEVIAAHLVKLQLKGKRKKRYICLDCWNKKDDTYTQVVFMKDVLGKADTSEDYFKVYTKVEQKSRKKITKKRNVGIAFTDTSRVGIKSNA